MLSGKLRIAGVVRESSVDGEGLRYVIFTQGCNHNCKGCHNPQTHDMLGGKEAKIDSIIKDILKNPLLSGVTISGGEPLLQIDNLIPLVRELKSLDYHIMMYTGFTYEEIWREQAFGDDTFTNVGELLKYVDILVDGRFNENQKDLTLLYRGSKNQRLIDVKKSLGVGCVQLWQEPNDLTAEMSDLDNFLNL